MTGLNGHVVLVTGAAGGVGSALVAELVHRGATVMATDIDDHRLAEVTARHPPDSAIPVPADLTDPSSCRGLVDRVTASRGRLDAVVNNAALLRSGALDSFPVEAFDEMVAVNLRAPFLISQVAFGWMADHGGGRIVNVASVGARDGGGSLDVAAYTTVKSGLLGMTKAFAKFGAPHGILVNTVLPGGIDTAMIATARADSTRRRDDIPAGRLATPSEIAHLICWLCSHENTYCAGAAIDVNGGRYLP